MTLIKDRYRIIGELGEGGFGKTFLTVDEVMSSKPTCVVKQLKPQFTATPETIRRFRQEARILERLGDEHDRIPRLLGYFEVEEQFYLVQEYIPGKTLKQLIEEGKTQDEAYARFILLELLPVLEFLHGRKIIHRDIAPDNIIIREKDGKPVLIDFGLVKELMVSEAYSMTTEGVGKRGYMAFEQINGQPVYASDIYALGMTAIALLTGGARLKRDYKTGEIQWKDLISCPLSQDFKEILSKATQDQVKDRYIQASEMLEALKGKKPWQIALAAMPLGDVPLPGDVTVGAADMKFVYVPSGEFEMGGTEYSDEQPIHTVTIRNSFLIGKYPVTQAQWELVMGTNPSYFNGDGRLPVENVSWEDCQRFIEKLNAMKDGNLYALPTEAEWEYACRAGTKTAFSFGDVLLTSQANYNGNYPYGNGPKGEYREKTTPVDSFPANEWGLHDMHGNVWEWCQDRWHENYEGAPPDGSARESSENEARVLRGGSWNYYAVYCRSALRGWLEPDCRGDSVGFRCVIRFART